MWLKKISEFIVFSSIFIGLCAVALCIETNILLHLPFNSFSFYCFVFGATLVQYNLHYLVKTVAVKNSQRLLWSSGNKLTHKILLASGVALILFSFFSFRLHHFIILSILGAVAFLYSFPLIPFGKKRIKDFGVLKIITLALMWTLVTVWFPANSFVFEKNIFLFIILERFAFMFVLCLLFDIRDIDIDRIENIRTLAVILEKKYSYRTVYSFLFFFLLLSLLQFLYYHDLNALLAMALSFLITLFVAERSKKTNSDFFYLAGIDGMMLLQFVLVYLFVLKF